ncbi:hypothetical protein NBZ79_07760 [Sneathiella marina]|uniref:Fe2OG dioxygenase domain-containing protein n=1 Tax=Sneathiella marina TaxID=2950108 RepID=A0ABY4W6Q9_9PROT|nr:hypothetical protein [Sneathiella marina]USG62870.1 hypothetical protein NBZ79_07760 [Sneathiella marina]
MPLLATPLAFPDIHPDGFPALPSEPPFDPARHLALEMPETIVSLGELGYSAAEQAACPSMLGITSAFRILSEEGVACLQEVARNLAPYARKIERISRMVRGGVYQSKFLRDFCCSADVADLISRISGAPQFPHSIPHQLGHLNYNPQTVGENVDKWHVDTLRLDYVLFVTDPNLIEGGEFDYFQGTKGELEQLKITGQPVPAARVKSPAVPGAGYAVLQQGNMVVHRARALHSAGERITLVNGYVPADLSIEDFTRFDQLYLADPEHIAASEYARHIAWWGQQLLTSQINDPAFTADRSQIARRLEQVSRLLGDAAGQIRTAETARMEHFGDQ